MSDKEEKKSIDDLRWIRVFSPDLIPKYLIEQVKDREFTVEDFYKYQSLNCLVEGGNGPTLNPFNHLHVLANRDNLVKGFLWFIVDPLCKDIVINTFSIDKEYWFKGKAVKKLAEYVKGIMNKSKLKKVYWITNYPKHSERYGFKKSEHVLMEYTEVNDGGISKSDDGGSG